jgi:hypothetical protein
MASCLVFNLIIYFNVFSLVSLHSNLAHEVHQLHVLISAALQIECIFIVSYYLLLFFNNIRAVTSW